MYHANLGRFLSPDNFIQDPYNTQSFNRYGYVLNNPLKYNDPSGELFVTAMIIGAIVGAYIGGAQANGGNWNAFDWDWSSGSTWAGLGIGAVVGAIGGEVLAAGLAGAPAFGVFNVSLSAGIVIPGVGTFGITKAGDGLYAEYTDPQGQTNSQHIANAPSGGGGKGGGNNTPSDDQEQTVTDAEDVIYSEVTNPWLGASIITGTLLADDVSGIGVADDLVIPIVLAGAATLDLTQRVHVTYILSNPNGQVYVGRTNGFADPVTLVNRRFATHHMRLYGFTNPRVDVAVQGADGYFAIRGREQQAIDYFGGVDSPNGGNRIRGVSKYNPLGRGYHNMSDAYFGPLYRYTGAF